MPRKSRVNKVDPIEEKKQVSNVDNNGSCSSPDKSHSSGSSVVDENHSITSRVSSAIKLARLEEKYLRREKQLKDALRAAERKLESIHLRDENPEFDKTPLAPADNVTAYDMATYLRDCKENLPPKPTEENKNFAHSYTVDLPKVEIARFDGNPVNYWRFIKQFEYYVESKTSDNGQRFLYLLYYCEGRAKESIEECVMLPPNEAYTRARKILKDLYGQNFHVARALIDGLLSDVKRSVATGDDLFRLAVKMQNCSIALGQMDYKSDLNAVTTLEQIVKALPSGMRFKWAEAVDKLAFVGREPLFDDLMHFIFAQARILSNRFGQLAQSCVSDTRGFTPNSLSAKTHHSKEQTKRFSYVTSSTSDSLLQRCRLCDSPHGLHNCQQFLKLEIPERWETVRQLGLCFICLKSSHRAKDCSSRIRCTESNCKGKHNNLLHYKRPNVLTPTVETKTVCSATKCATKAIRSGIIPVCIRSPKGIVRTLAFLDSGSDTTLVRRSFAENHSLKGRPSALTVTTLGGTNTINCSKLKLEIISVDGKETITAEEAFTVDELPVKALSSIEQEAKRWPHLRDVPFVEFEDDEVNVLIGCDVPEAHWTLDQRLSGRKQPYAVKTLLGWVLCGPLRDDAKGRVTINCMCSEDPSIAEQIRFLYDQEFADTSVVTETYSIEEKKALAIVEKGTCLIGEHYEIPLPWKDNCLKMPDNYPLAIQRLEYLRRRFMRDQSLFEKYKCVIQRHIDKGFIEPVSQNDRKEEHAICWYLPHHPVTNARKPGKLRIVFDCAAKYLGISLNDCLFQGPNLTTQLIEVLMRFRIDPVAVLADIEDMFLQVRVPRSHRNALRILWWPEHDLSKQPITYRMTVHPFGAVSSPFCANYALQRTVGEFSQLFVPSIQHTVVSNFYVDDYLASFPDIKTASMHVDQLPILLSRGGFHLTKWLSNKREVLDKIPDAERAPSICKVVNDRLPLERTLGISWDAETDEFIIKFCFPNKPATRRGILATISSLYDPLGFVAPWILPGRILLQDLCKKRMGWDEPLIEADERRWNDWINDLLRIGEIRIPRCIKDVNFETVNMELHIFCDASEVGYGVVAYTCMCKSNGERHPALLFSKARVAPLKAVSIPRLELSAAVLAVRTFQLINSATKVEYRDVTFWTDSMIVLYYINNVSTRFSTFVANRLSVIHDATSSRQWRHVKSNENPADKSSRGVREAKFIESWLCGPSFLTTSPEKWTMVSTTETPITGIETKKTAAQFHVSTNANIMMQLCQRYSDWMKLLKAVTWLRRFKHYWILMNTHNQQVPLNVGPVSLEELKTSELDVVRLVQSDAFPEIVQKLRNPTIKIVEKCSLLKLHPVLIDGTLRVGGRLANSTLSHETKYPVILPKQHHVVSLIVRHFHVTEGHAGVSHVLAAIRQRFWILHGVSAVRRVIGTCIFCRRQNARASSQMMAHLPPVRVQPGWHPFSQVGLDYFGPFEVRRGRVLEKRYGCVITCLQSRAVHIEIAHSMNTDSFVMLLLRFVGRRGIPTDIYSDNGSNFIGADKELRNWIDELDQHVIQQRLLNRSIRWHFNPPYASHRGGVWERLIRSIRRTLNAVCSEQTFDDETLLTSLIECERILNNRPLVPIVSDDPHFSSLSPNDLLLLRENPGLPLRETITGRFTARWRRANYLASIFWRRWIKEYLPTLQLRQKWLSRKRNFSVGDIVLVTIDSTPKNIWPLGIITRCFPDEDGLVRTVEVKTRTGKLRRDIRRICLLEGDDMNESREYVSLRANRETSTTSPNETLLDDRSA